VVRIDPFHYTGKVWCLKVPTGCFVAVRDGMAFPTGNSGFPKSLDVSKAIDKAAGAEREVVGQRTGAVNPKGYKTDGNAQSGGAFAAGEFNITAPATPEAQQWAGWGTALKPALEPITVARKPLAGTVAANVLEHGTGALNIDGCRVGAPLGRPLIQPNHCPGFGDVGKSGGSKNAGATTEGRWPANLILTYPEDEYKLKDNITPQQHAKLAEWMNENA
jgi:site-specific DNA-methyltransferase (adenine-specific)